MLADVSGHGGNGYSFRTESADSERGGATRFAFAATKLALNDAGFGKGDLDFSGPIPVVVGVSTSSLDVIERVFHHVSQSRPDRVTPFALGASKPQAAANVIADHIGASANASTISSACPSGLDAVAAAASMIRRGEADLAIAGEQTQRDQHARPDHSASDRELCGERLKFGPKLGPAKGESPL